VLRGAQSEFSKDPIDVAGEDNQSPVDSATDDRRWLGSTDDPLVAEVACSLACMAVGEVRLLSELMDSCSTVYQQVRWDGLACRGTFVGAVLVASVRVIFVYGTLWV
jgi:hypothetical protein